MNHFQTHDPATDLAADRTAYSLARELLGVRAQLAEMRDTLASMEAEEGQEITALAEQIEALDKDNKNLRREVAAWRGA